jgi:four helix bundle protein
MQDYKKLLVWRKAHEFTLAVYQQTMSFPDREQYGITNQIRRAAYSIPSNIEEGCGKSTNADFAKFLNIALGSANESEYFLLLSKDLGFLEKEVHLKLETQINEIKAMLIGLIKKVRAYV